MNVLKVRTAVPPANSASIQEEATPVSQMTVHKEARETQRQDNAKKTTPVCQASPSTAWPASVKVKTLTGDSEHFWKGWDEELLYVAKWEMKTRNKNYRTNSFIHQLVLINNRGWDGVGNHP